MWVMKLRGLLRSASQNITAEVVLALILQKCKILLDAVTHLLLAGKPRTYSHKYCLVECLASETHLCILVMLEL